MRISTLFGGEFKGAVRTTELSVTTNMAASKILQDSMAVSSLSVKIEKKNSLRIRLTVFCSVYKSNQLIVRIWYFKFQAFVCVSLSVHKLSWIFVLVTVVPTREINGTFLTDILSFVFDLWICSLIVSKYHIVDTTVWERCSWVLGVLFCHIDYLVINEKKQNFHRLPFLFVLCMWIPLRCRLVRVAFRNVWRLRACWMVFIWNEGEVVLLFYIIFSIKKWVFFFCRV